MTTRTWPAETVPVSAGDTHCADVPVYWVIGGAIDFYPMVVPSASGANCPGLVERLIWLSDRHQPDALGDVGLTSASVLARSALRRTASATADLISEELLLEGQLAARFEGFVFAAGSERLSDGMGSLFADRVRESVLEHGPVAVAAWERAVLKCRNRNETGEELMRQLGLLRDARSHSARLRVLVDALARPDATVRDAAGIGLSLLEDPSALPKLRAAYDSETEAWVRDGIALVIDELEEAGSCVT